ncbi:MAG: TonB-dependent receptor plug domain-containing protein, partial [Candidatus Omnitrophica bacterium]|nr:TonB-dependent receptor plug domain-containing protein [Candidatus Omnitrophota bacterium]
MLKIDRRGLVFIIVNIFSCSATAFSAGNPSLDLEKIVVSKADSHVFNSYSLKDSDLKASPFNSPIEALNLSCVDLQGRAPKDGIQTDFSLRGSNFQGVLMLIDGQRINDPQTGHFNSDIPITSEDIEKIEVLPGIGSSLFGPDAIGGAIDIIRKKPKERKIILEAGYGQYKTWGGLLSVTEKIDDLGLRLSLENRESNGFHEDTDFKKFTASLSSSLDIPDGEFNFDLGYQEKE